MMISWAHAGPSVLAAFLASLVEFVEALTVVLAVGSVRGWRAALIGASLDDGSLAVAVVVWIATALLVFPALPIGQGVRAVILFAGIGAILVENVVRTARRRPPA